MKVFVTGVAGQLGHDVMNELAKRGYEGIGSDIAPVSYSGVQDDSRGHNHALCCHGYHRQQKLFVKRLTRDQPGCCRSLRCMDSC